MGADHMPGLPHSDPQPLVDFHKNFKFSSFHLQNLFALSLQRTLSAAAGQVPGICIGLGPQGRPGLGAPHQAEFHELLEYFV